MPHQKSQYQNKTAPKVVVGVGLFASVLLLVLLILGDNPMSHERKLEKLIASFPEHGSTPEISAAYNKEVMSQAFKVDTLTILPGCIPKPLIPEFELNSIFTIENLTDEAVIIDINEWNRLEIPPHSERDFPAAFTTPPLDFMPGPVPDEGAYGFRCNNSEIRGIIVLRKYQNM